MNALAPTPDILRVMDSPKLWRAHFEAPSWAPWRAFLAALFALPMTDAQFDTYRACTGSPDAANDAVQRVRGGLRAPCW